ncbi:hypothetical protein COV56_03715 [Candidatus Kuenenbacteria bacterium CG11_big_fil_rev_8_21_14_0_20_37_9]|nr:MAG: hypothetical protein COV56_03715 [Candidatus Kuenenbacteria bacterium CG11_big_fil_rev_8_21_14_0_20_37_9]
MLAYFLMFVNTFQYFKLTIYFNNTSLILKNKKLWITIYFYDGQKFTKNHKMSRPAWTFY